MNTWGMMEVHVVEAGTMIKDPTCEQDDLEVTDENAVFRANAIYCTQRIWEGLKAKAEEKKDARDTH